MVFVFGSGWRLGAGFVNPVSPGWGLGWVFLGSICGVVPLVSAICGVRGWASVSACLWDVCGFVGAPLARCRFRFRRAVWACVLGPGLACAQSVLAGLSGCVFFFFALWFFLFFFFFFLGFVVPVPPSPFFRAGLVALFFFFFRVPFPRGPLLLAWCCRFSVGGSPVPLRGSPFFFFFSFFLGGGPGRLWWCWRVVGRLWAVFVPFPLPPSLFFFFSGGACLFLPLPSLGWRTHWPVFSVVFWAAVFSCVLCEKSQEFWVTSAECLTKLSTKYESPEGAFNEGALSQGAVLRGQPRTEPRPRLSGEVKFEGTKEPHPAWEEQR